MRGLAGAGRVRLGFAVMVPGAMIGAFPGVALAQWTVYGLGPTGSASSRGFGAGSAQQVGSAWVGGVQRASVWNGTAASWVDLHPAGACESAALDAYGGRQVG